MRKFRSFSLLVLTAFVAGQFTLGLSPSFAGEGDAPLFWGKVHSDAPALDDAVMVAPITISVSKLGAVVAAERISWRHPSLLSSHLEITQFSAHGAGEILALEIFREADYRGPPRPG